MLECSYAGKERQAIHFIQKIQNKTDGSEGAQHSPEVSPMKGTLLGAAGAILVLFGLQFYGMHTTKVSMESRMDEMQSKIESLQADQNARIAELTNNVSA